MALVCPTLNEKEKKTMSTGNSLLFAAGITAVSVAMLTITRGLPTLQNLTSGAITMFVIAFIVMKFWGGDNKK